MVDQFVGTWKLCESKGFDEYMQCLGVGFTTRKAAIMAKPNVVVSKNGDEISLKTQSSLKTTEVKFRLGEEFEETTADDRKTKTIITCDDGVLTQVQKWDGKSTTIKRELKNGQLVVTCSMGDVTCVRVYDKV
ncbi:fatty acid-binding protein, adipocyte-like [Bufo gargarizans]|uniref:fatty acid-binding protein, adipocyte-like n=1 Tax=Bufo gargarizans TaxID=30331 RepID=UPI001CF126F5|nr:fatty acid-binding protein, adipocyte-like [Bufo gargarizans]